MTEGNPAAAEIHRVFRELEGRHGLAENELRRKLWARLEYVRDRQEAGVLVRPLGDGCEATEMVLSRWEGYLSEGRGDNPAPRVHPAADAGERFGRWTVIEDLNGSPRMVECLCDCGTVGLVALRKLRTGRSKSCGCVRGRHG
jgi:hypothetical protein